MDCPNCGRPTRPAAKFCPKCGQKLSDTPSPLVTQPAAVPDADSTVVVRSADIRATAAPMASPASIPVPVVAETARTAEAVSPKVPSKRAWYRPGAAAYLVTIALTVGIYAVVLAVLDPHKATWYWTMTRATGFVVYSLLSLTVALGTLLAVRRQAYTGVWRFVERLHPLLLIAAGAVVSFHIGGMLLINFPVSSAFIPFASSFRPGDLGLGIVSMYLAIVLFLSTYLIRSIGVQVWRMLHYAGFLAWVMALLHARDTGHDVSAGWAGMIYAAGAILVLGLLVIFLARRLYFNRRRAATT